LTPKSREVAEGLGKVQGSHVAAFSLVHTYRTRQQIDVHTQKQNKKIVSSLSRTAVVIQTNKISHKVGQKGFNMASYCQPSSGY
jgi:hypothetical protein